MILWRYAEKAMTSSPLLQKAARVFSSCADRVCFAFPASRMREYHWSWSWRPATGRKDFRGLALTRLLGAEIPSFSLDPAAPSATARLALLLTSEQVA